MTEEAGLALVFSGQHSRVIAVALLNEAAPQQQLGATRARPVPPVLFSSPWRRFWRDLEPVLAAGQPAAAFGVGWGVVELVVVVKGRLVRSGKLIAVQFDVGGGLNLVFRDRNLQVVGADRDSGEWDEGEVAADQALLNGAEHRLVGVDVDVDVFELADPFSVAVDECLAVPFADVLV